MNQEIYKTMSVIAESYLSSVEQLANTIKAEDKYTKKYTNTTLEDKTNAQFVLGKSLYKKYEQNGNMDTYAPISVASLNLTFSDFKNIFKKWIADDETMEKYAEKIIDAIKKEYNREEFKISYNDNITSNIVFRTFENFCHFISFIYKQVAKLCKNAPVEYINWKPLVIKFKAYI